MTRKPFVFVAEMLGRPTMLSFPGAIRRERKPLTPEDMERAVKVDQLLHPNGRCTCAGEGTCSLCNRVCQKCMGDAINGCSECNGTGLKL